MPFQTEKCGIRLNEYDEILSKFKGCFLQKTMNNKTQIHPNLAYIC